MVYSIGLVLNIPTNVIARLRDTSFVLSIYGVQNGGFVTDKVSGTCGDLIVGLERSGGHVILDLRTCQCVPPTSMELRALGSL